MFLKCLVTFTKYDGYIVYTYDDDVLYQLYLDHCYNGTDGFLEGIYNMNSGEVIHTQSIDLSVLYRHGTFHNQEVY